MPCEVHGSSSVLFCKRYHQRDLFLDMLMEWFLLQLQKVPIFHQGEALPHFHCAFHWFLMHTVPGMDWTLFKDWPASRIAASRSSPCDFLWRGVKNLCWYYFFLWVLREWIPFQLWTVICYKGSEWNGMQEWHVPCDKKDIYWWFARW